MIDTNDAIYKLLTGDTVLRGMLASNSPLFSPSSAKTTANSIVSADMVNRKLETPFITIQEGNENVVSHRKLQTFYIRCYNDNSKSYIRINEILDRVRELLTQNQLALDDRRFVKVINESRMPGLSDEAVDMKFKEERYVIEVL